MFTALWNYLYKRDGELESRFVLKILHCDYHCDCITRPYCFGVVGITVVISKMFSFFSVCLSLLPSTCKVRPGFCVCSKLSDVKYLH